MEQIQGIMLAARDTSSPVIVQASRGARSYAGDRFLYHLMLAASRSTPRSRLPCTRTTATHVADYDYNAAGGRMAPAFGMPVEEIQLGIRHGVRKVNVDTDGRLAITAAARQALAGKPDEFDPRHVTRACREAMRDVVAERMRQFGQAGHAGDYQPRSLEDMRRMYEAQEPTGAAA